MIADAQVFHVLQMCMYCAAMRKNCGPTPLYWGEQPCIRTGKAHNIILICKACTAKILRLIKMFIELIFPTIRCL